MSSFKKVGLCLGTMVLFSFFSVLLSAQDNMGKQDNMGQKTSATGCLMKGSSDNGYYLKAEDGTTYELWGDKSLGEHVNHKVTVTGMQEKMPHAMEEKNMDNEKTEASGGTQMDLKVTHVKMISKSCQ